MDIGLTHYSHDKSHFKHYNMLRMMIFFIIFNFVFDLWFLMLRCAEPDDDLSTMTNIFTFMRILRPIYLIYRSRTLSLLLKSIFEAISSLFELALIVVMFWMLFTMIGNALLSDLDIVGQSDYFVNFGESLWSLIVLQTTCNFPDVMLFSYSHSQWVALYFFAYNLFGIFLLTPLILAFIYKQYSEHHQKHVENVNNIKNRGKRQCFKYLVKSISKERIQEKEKINGKLTATKQNDVPKFHEPKLIYFEQFNDICCAIRSDFRDNKEQQRRVRDKYCEFTGLPPGSLTPHIFAFPVDATGGNGNVSNSENIRNDNGMNLKQFRKIDEFVKTYTKTDLTVTLHLQLTKKIKILNYQIQIESNRDQDSPHDQNVDINTGNASTYPKYLSIKLMWYQARLNCIDFFDWTYSGWYLISTQMFIRIFLAFSVIVVIIDLYVYNGKATWIVTLESIVVWILFLEMLLRLFAFGFIRYISDNRWNKFNFGITLILWIVNIIAQSAVSDDATNLLRAIKIIRIFQVLRSFDMLENFLNFLFIIIKNFKGIFEFEFCIIYIFVIIGCQIFNNNLITKENACSKCDSENYDEFWCSTVCNGYYYTLNFNSFSRGLAVLMALVVVNNWQVVTEMFALTYGEASKIYFTCVYFIGALIVVNLLTAFVLDIFINNYDKYKTQYNFYHYRQNISNINPPDVNINNTDNNNPNNKNNKNNKSNNSKNKNISYKPNLAINIQSPVAKTGGGGYPLGIGIPGAPNSRFDGYGYYMNIPGATSSNGNLEQMLPNAYAYRSMRAITPHHLGRGFEHSFDWDHESHDSSNADNNNNDDNDNNNNVNESKNDIESDATLTADQSIFNLDPKLKKFFTQSKHQMIGQMYSLPENQDISNSNNSNNSNNLKSNLITKTTTTNEK